jgi:hypothetical protein
MEIVTGIFDSRQAAEKTFSELSTSPDFHRDNLLLLTPDPATKTFNIVPTDEGEQPGMGSAIGGVVGGAVGLAAGAVLANLVFPGVGPILMMTLSAGSGVGGAALGAAGGSAAERALSNGLPKDELFFYEDALRCGRSLIIAMANSNQEAERARSVMQRDGADSVDAAREKWWIGLRDGEAAHYGGAPADFIAQEKIYRAGFEAALQRESRDKPFSENLAELRARYPEACREEAFRRGYERGREYCRARSENNRH